MASNTTDDSSTTSCSSNTHEASSHPAHSSLDVVVEKSEVSSSASTLIATADTGFSSIIAETITSAEDLSINSSMSLASRTRPTLAMFNNEEIVMDHIPALLGTSTKYIERIHVFIHQCLDLLKLSVANHLPSQSSSSIINLLSHIAHVMPKVGLYNESVIYQLTMRLYTDACSYLGEECQ